MKRTKLLFLIGVFVGILPVASRAQYVSFVNVLLVASDGTEEVRFKGAESELEDLNDYFSGSFGGRQKSRILLPLSKLGKVSALQQIASTYANSDSSDLLVAAWLGPWKRNQAAPSMSAFVSNHTETIPAEYVTSFINFIPAQSAFLFIVSPQGDYEFPTELLRDYPAAAAVGGKHVIIVKPRVRMSYGDMVDAFVGVIKKMRKIEETDGNKDGWITSVEWLREFYRKSQAAKLSLSGFTIEPSREFRISQVKK